ncbi:Hypothetical predicted protein [Mytilus galloprovincialis]|uniref:Cyanophycinase n=1 Tax=Mytilus galloprovincialis TaxID=29158 RepID=A0A8B6BWF5_MYTGA|nr:Hypothetical predicted protein [Mytilus galloprovincialis]
MVGTGAYLTLFFVFLNVLVSTIQYCPSISGGSVPWWILYQQKDKPFIHYYVDSTNNENITVHFPEKSDSVLSRVILSIINTESAEYMVYFSDFLNAKNIADIKQIPMRSQWMHGLFATDNSWESGTWLLSNNLLFPPTKDSNLVSPESRQWISSTIGDSGIDLFYVCISADSNKDVQSIFGKILAGNPFVFNQRINENAFMKAYLQDVRPLNSSFSLHASANLFMNCILLMKWRILMTGGVNHAKLGIVLAASGDFNATCTFYVNVFLDMYHAHSVYCIPINVNTTSANSDPHVIERIKQQTGIFFAGGEPESVIESLFYKNHVPSPALLAIKEMFDAGILVSGSSAGAECMPSAVMVWGGTGSSYNALQFGTYEGSEVSDRDYQLYDKDGGVGLLDGFIIDAHFSERGREGRLIRLLSDTRHLHHGTDWGFGNWYKGVFFADVSQSNITAKYNSYSITNVMVDYLTRGDSIFLKNKTIIFSSTKSQMSGFERNSRARTSKDIFNSYITISHSNEPLPVHYPEFVKVANSLFDSNLTTLVMVTHMNITLHSGCICHDMGQELKDIQKEAKTCKPMILLRKKFTQ